MDAIVFLFAIIMVPVMFYHLFLRVKSNETERLEQRREDRRRAERAREDERKGRR